MENFEKVGDLFNCKLLLQDNTTFTIPMREDGYIFATALCKAVNKRVNHWLRLKETKDLVKKLENDIHIHTSGKLIEIYKGGNDKYNQGTWIHPDLGIHLVQWCSSNFTLQVSKWIKELIFTNKVELRKEKNNDELQQEFEKLKKQLEEQILLTKEFENELENKTKEFNFLQNKVNRFQKRENFTDKNVLYIVTCDEIEKDRIYIFGKAVDLKLRLTTYNKSLEHKVVYYKGFKNMYHMKTAELMLLYKLNQYKDEKTLKDRFVLPEDKEISFFTNVVDEIHNWFENIENVIIDTKESDKEDKNLPRKQGKFDRNSVYLLTSDIHLKKKTYIIGKSKNLNSRLSAYNKSVDHTVEYNKKCNNINQMNVIELMILYKLDNFRERMNRDRFILPEDKDVSFFTEIFDKAVNWFNNIDSKLEIIKNKETKEQERKDNKKIYRQENKEKITEIQKNYREKNKEKLNIKSWIYRETHKKQVSDGKKDWYNRNKDTVINRVKNNYVNNRDEKLSKVKEYASKNQDKIKARQSIKITCECGSVFGKYTIKKHLQTVIHQEYLKIIESIHTEFTNETSDRRFKNSHIA